MINLSFFKGPGVALGLLAGLVLGAITGKYVTFVLLGLLFGIFAEEEYDADHISPSDAKMSNTGKGIGTLDA